MKEEIEAAVHFVGRVIISSNGESITSFSEFKVELLKVMEEKFKGHWHNDTPGKGQGYRSIRIHPHEPLDPVLNRAAVQSKFSIMYLRIPVELTVWVDPKDVTCRFGDLKSTYCTVLKDKDNQASKLDVDELLENAKALYSRQQHFVILDGPQPCDVPFTSTDMASYPFTMNGFQDSYLYPAYGMYPPWHTDGSVDGSTPPPFPPYGAPPPPMGLNTTPRKNGKNHFRKGSSNGTGRGSKHQHHHQQHHQHHHHHSNHHHSHPPPSHPPPPTPPPPPHGHHDGGFTPTNLNHNHVHNHHHNSAGSSISNGGTPNGSTPTLNGHGPGSGGSSNGGRFQLVKGTKNFHQFYNMPTPLQPFGPMHQQHQQRLDHQQPKRPEQHPMAKRRLNSESDKDLAK